MELIDRQALKDAVKRYAGEPIKKKDRKCQAICLDMLGTIDAQHTIDAVEVVRCGECKWYDPPDKSRPFFCPVMDCVNGVMRDDYCSRGERREG